MRASGAFRPGTVGRAQEFASEIGHFVKFIFGETGLGVEAGLGKQDELAEIAEGGGAPIGNAVGGHGPEDALESAVNVETTVFLGEELRKFRRKILVEGRAGFIDFGMGAAIVADSGGHGADASVGEFEMAEVGEGGVLAPSGHAGIIYCRVMIMQ